ncbi:MAG: hypothetical protein HON98_12545 [Chloroflexi bacterium]|mgnify:FL=1|jgi:hypothetical protein|nr:hypothetical protein [Chloroflexota bacterium]MBT4002962.1 hypothetical protein [Chloroflexota bacterium]MBT4305790.1 hypothetical protein [Chloroflexota bacterium]MBT4533614.1 hypothetical protein [Chloroflexota bacterium]MBT4681743.1 hypothetical protein [Chloroflexota bacterium]
MRNKRNLDRERLEMILMHILMRFRLYLMICGVILLVVSLYFTSVNSGISLMGSLMALLMMLPFFSFKFVIYAAKVGAWLGTLRDR